jgi:CBS-domain-containing membrane protein
VTILEVSVTQAATTAPSSSPWYVSSAPPRQRLHVIVVETIVSFIALGIVVCMGIDALWGGALAGALALGVMKLVRMSHSPAAATAMIGVAPVIPRWEFVVLIGCAAAILVAVGLVGNKINRAKYPHYWW